MAWALITAALSVLCVHAAAAPPTAPPRATFPTLSAEQIAEAIAFGKSHKKAEIRKLYSLGRYSFGIAPDVSVETAFSRIALAAAEANEKAMTDYTDFKPPTVTAAMKADNSLLMPSCCRISRRLAWTSRTSLSCQQERPSGATLSVLRS